MFQTRIPQLFGIQYPIVQGGLHWLATAELASAVSQTGGLGLISSLSFPDQEALRREIGGPNPPRKIKFNEENLKDKSRPS